MMRHLLMKPQSRMMFSRPFPPPNGQHMFLVGFMAGFLCGISVHEKN
jgi:hypothetical protein